MMINELSDDDSSILQVMYSISMLCQRMKASHHGIMATMQYHDITVDQCLTIYYPLPPHSHSKLIQEINHP